MTLECLVTHISRLVGSAMLELFALMWCFGIMVMLAWPSFLAGYFDRTFIFSMKWNCYLTNNSFFHIDSILYIFFKKMLAFLLICLHYIYSSMQYLVFTSNPDFKIVAKLILWMLLINWANYELYLYIFICIKQT